MIRLDTAVRPPYIGMLAAALGVIGVSRLRCASRGCRDAITAAVWRAAKRGQHIWKIILAAGDVPTLCWVARTFGATVHHTQWSLIGDMIWRGHVAQAIWALDQGHGAAGSSITRRDAKFGSAIAGIGHLLRMASVNYTSGRYVQALDPKQQNTLLMFVKKFALELRLSGPELRLLVAAVPDWPSAAGWIDIARRAGDDEWTEYLAEQLLGSEADPDLAISELERLER